MRTRIKWLGRRIACVFGFHGPLVKMDSITR